MELGFYGNLEIEMIREGIRKERASEIANQFRGQFIIQMNFSNKIFKKRFFHSTEKLVTLKQVKLADDKILEEMIDQLGIKDAIDFKKVKTILDEMKGNQAICPRSIFQKDFNFQAPTKSNKCPRLK